MFLRAGHSIRFEKQLPVVEGRNPANLDVWIEQDSSVVAVESKFLEYFKPKKAEFAEAYESLASAAEPSWWNIYRESEELHNSWTEHS